MTTKKTPLLEIKALCKSYKDFQVLKEISLNIDHAEIVGLVGESGSGKSTLGKCILGLEEIDSGSILFQGKNTYSIKRKHLSREIQMIFQDPTASLNPRMNIEQIVQEGLIIHNLYPKERKEKVVELLNKVGLDSDCLYRYPHQFSGGQKQRIGIARALAVEPKFLICDEPLSALDVSVQAQVINLLAELAKNEGLSYLFISHDLSVVRYLADRVVVLQKGRVVEQGKTELVLFHPNHCYTKELLSAIPDW